MEILIFIGALVALDVFAYFFGEDSRELGRLDHHERALSALRRGDLADYRDEMKRLEREVSRVAAIRF